MAALPSIYNGWGAHSFPLTVTPEFDLLRTLDPGRLAIAELLDAAIRAEVGDIWRQCINEIAPDHYLIANNPDGGALEPVMFTMLQEPDYAAMQQMHGCWPLLAVHRVGEPVTQQKTIDYPITIQSWAVDWVIGPLDVAEYDRIGLAAIPVANVIRYTLDEGFHPAYQNGARQFYGQFGYLKVTGQHGPGVAKMLGEEKGLGFFGLTIMLETSERKIKTAGHASDVLNKYYPAFAAQAARGTPVTEMLFDPTYPNKTPDPPEEP